MIAKLLLYKILQLFMMMVVGFLIAKFKIVKSEESDILSKISLYLLMPSAIMNAFNFKRTSEMTKGLLLAFVTAFVMHIAFLILDRAYGKLSKISPVARASVMYSNAGNLIIPIVTFILGEEWVVYSTAFLSVQLLFIWTHAIRIFSPDIKFSIKKIILNPNIIAIACGLILLLLNVQLPVFVKDITSSFSSMLGPIAMLTAGILATKIDITKAFKCKSMYIVSLIRTVVYPVVTFMIVKLLSYISVANCKQILLISFLASITPVASTVMQFAQIKKSNTDLAVQINIFSTVLSVVTMPIWIVLYSNLV